VSSGKKLFPLPGNFLQRKRTGILEQGNQKTFLRIDGAAEMNLFKTGYGISEEMLIQFVILRQSFGHGVKGHIIDRYLLKTE